MKRDPLYLVHMGECIARIEQYTQGGEVEFFRDAKTQDAVLRNLQIMSESSQRLSTELKAAHTDIDWMGISDFRNVLAHDYLGLNLHLVWKIVREELPNLKQKINALLETPAS